jgi:hypothetical protein
LQYQIQFDVKNPFSVENLFHRFGNNLFDLDSTVETILCLMEQDIDSAVDSGKIPAGTGQSPTTEVVGLPVDIQSSEQWLAPSTD